MKIKFIPFFLSLLILSLGNHLEVQEWKRCMAKCAGVGVILSIFSGGLTALAAGGACITICGVSPRCFQKNTLISTPNGQTLITNLSKGDKILTMDNIQTTITQIFIDDKEHVFVKIQTQTGFLEVTQEHLMIVNQTLISAKNLQIGMRIGNQQIINIERVIKSGKVTIITAEGTVIANSIPTTLICAEYENLTLKEGLKRWRKDHQLILMQ